MSLTVIMKVLKYRNNNNIFMQQTDFLPWLPRDYLIITWSLSTMQNFIFNTFCVQNLSSAQTNI